MKITKLLLALALMLSACTTQQKTTGIIRKDDSNLPDLSNAIITKIHVLPKTVTETSGLIVYENHPVTMNDSGNKPALYRINEDGSVTENLIPGTENRDWEALTQDANFIYIADIGNNYGNRKDLKIYKINKDNLAVAPKVIEIAYAEQKQFKHAAQSHEWDAEALVAIGDHLYLFSKNWKDLETHIYKIDKNSSKQSLVAIQKIKLPFLVTDADYRNGVIVLSGYKKSLKPYISLLELRQDGFEVIKNFEIPLDGAQVEAISITKTSTSTIEGFITCEAVNIKRGDVEAAFDSVLYSFELVR